MTALAECLRWLVLAVVWDARTHHSDHYLEDLIDDVEIDWPTNVAIAEAAWAGDPCDCSGQWLREVSA